jgi:uncharacterized protein
MREYKIVFTGSMGAGKTTAIAAISDQAPLSTDVANTDAAVAKATTTVGLDFGEMLLDNGDRLRLFGTPGQVRFDFMWKILVKNALGMVILVNNSGPNPLADLDVYLEGFAAELAAIPCVIGVGWTEDHPRPGVDDYARHVESKGCLIPVVAVDVRQRADVVLLLDMLLAQMGVDTPEVPA